MPHQLRLLIVATSGPVTNVAFGLVRALDYLSIALVVGVLAFLAVVAGPPLRGAAFERRAWRLVAAGAALGVAVGVLGILLAGAQAAGVSLWGALRWSVISSVLGSRFGVVWATRAALLAATLVVVGRPRGRRSTPWFAGLAAYLVLTPALAGHAAVQSPVWVLVPSDALHVAAASVWVGGVAAILLALPLATRTQDPAQRTRLLVDVLGRFSRSRSPPSSCSPAAA